MNCLLFASTFGLVLRVQLPKAISDAELHGKRPRSPGKKPRLVRQCSIMRKTSVRELHIHSSELVREASDGGVILIERRGEPAAELRPIASPPRMPAARKARIFTSMRKLRARMPQGGDSTRILEEDRGR
jgi:prevent-host-death family protein